MSSFAIFLKKMANFFKINPPDPYELGSRLNTRSESNRILNEILIFSKELFSISNVE